MNLGQTSARHGFLKSRSLLDTPDVRLEIGHLVGHTARAVTHE
jgi:hypothetical protein